MSSKEIYLTLEDAEGGRTGHSVLVGETPRVGEHLVFKRTIYRVTRVEHPAYTYQEYLSSIERDDPALDYQPEVFAVEDHS